MYKINNNSYGENISVVYLSENEAFLTHEQRDTTDPWFYWAFHADDLPDKEITFKFTYEVVGPFGPAVSLDGVRWQWLGADSSPNRRTFKYKNTDGHKRVWFSFCLGYRPQNLSEFIKAHENNPLFQVSVLAVSEKGADIPIIKIGQQDARYHVLLTARHHACETSGNYVMEGFIEHILAGGFMADNCLIYAVPFVDYDGVVAGDQGKSRAPHDHNRDYIETPIYSSVRAIKAIADNHENSMMVALDFHAPMKWGGRDDEVHFHQKTKNNEQFHDNTEAYIDTVRNLREKDNKPGQIPIGKIYYNLTNGTAHFSGYMNTVKKIPLAFTLETPYFGTHSTFMLSWENAHELGQLYARALDDYLQTSYNGSNSRSMAR